MLFVRDVPKEFATAEFYKGSSYHLVPDKLESDYAPVRFDRELRLFRRFCHDGSVLDVGCSTGGFLNQLATRWPGQYDVTGMDVAMAALEYASLKGVPVICDSLLTHDFGAKKFAAVTFWAVMEHLVEPQLCLGRAADLLKPGGHCFLLVPNATSLAIRLLQERYRYIMPEHLNYFSRETLRRFIGLEPRFQIRAMTTTHFNPIVLLQDWRSKGRPVPEGDRAQLLRRTTALKQRPSMGLLRSFYQQTENLLGRLGLADNLVAVLQKR